MLNMSIEETYKGMWSSDPSLLKSLLDAGNTILIYESFSMGRRLREYSLIDGKYTDGQFSARQWKEFIDFHSSTPLMFLCPPRPFVLEPKPLEWHHRDMNEEAFASYGDWSFYAWHDGSWEVKYGGYMIDAELFMPDNSDFDTAKTAINEWRVNHLKSMLP